METDAGDAGSSEARIYEVSPAGDELWRYALPTAFMIYRAERVPSLHAMSSGKRLAAMLSALRFQLECR